MLPAGSPGHASSLPPTGILLGAAGAAFLAAVLLTVGVRVGETVNANAAPKPPMVTVREVKPPKPAPPVRWPRPVRPVRHRHRAPTPAVVPPDEAAREAEALRQGQLSPSTVVPGPLAGPTADPVNPTPPPVEGAPQDTGDAEKMAAAQAAQDRRDEQRAAEEERQAALEAAKGADAAERQARWEQQQAAWAASAAQRRAWNNKAQHHPTPHIRVHTFGPGTFGASGSMSIDSGGGRRR